MLCSRLFQPGTLGTGHRTGKTDMNEIKLQIGGKDMAANSGATFERKSRSPAPW
jgi:hypothetical protein